MLESGVEQEVCITQKLVKIEETCADQKPVFNTKRALHFKENLFILDN